ncbi:MAG TPA: S53 family peptidase [Candidatus Acidoferrales bacterium]|nr:S53 family peptidase [Candidatus Acidoferrales bacterium]
MKKRILLVVTTAVLLTGLPPSAGSKPKRGWVSPFLKVGSRATPSGAFSANYGLFTCQLMGQSPDETCYDPYQVRHAYGIDTLVSAGFDGRGKTIVIIDSFQSPNIKQQLNIYNTFYGLPSLNGLGGPASPALGTFTQIAPDGLTPFDPTNDDMIGWAEEISLDVLWSHAIAPGANIVLVLAKSDADADILSATKYAVDHNLGNVISQSFGENESCMDPTLLTQQHQVFADATTRGITLFASAGDFGSAQPTCDGSSLVQAVSTPASDALVSAVGGTELHAARYCLSALGCNPAANPAPGTYQGEVVWNEPEFGSTGGGFSVVYDEPPYQKGTIHGGKQRGVPDISYSAAVLHGLLTYLDIPGIPAGYYSFGGTSAGSPQWAALLAIAGQKAGYSLGYINTALYHIGQAQSHYSASFFDVTSGNNSFFSIPGFSAGPGWDPATGLGSPSAAQLVNYLIQFVSPGDGVSAINSTKPHPNGNPSAPGHQRPH